jgi:hypothetical protein
MQGLNQELSKSIRNPEMLDLHNYLAVHEGHDTEAELQAVNSTIDLSGRSIGRIFDGSYVTYSYGKPHSMDFKSFVKLSQSLCETIRDTIFDVYQFKPGDISLYSELFSALTEATRSKQHYVYTTNYDRVIEEYRASTGGFTVTDGFAIDFRSRRNMWSPTIFDQAQLIADVSTVKLFKLHGSLNWRVSEFGIEQVMTEDILRQPTPVYKRNLLIYPGSKVPPEEEPFRTLYERFETQMREVDRCLVIGFSFRDPYLNRIFRDFVRSGKKQLLVMSSSCKETVANNLLELKSANEIAKLIEDNHFVPIACHFGDKNWLTMTTNALRTPNPA